MDREIVRDMVRFLSWVQFKGASVAELGLSNCCAGAAARVVRRFARYNAAVHPSNRLERAGDA
jgi:hypothetical protein